jgi:hypothetical protein
MASSGFQLSLTEGNEAQHLSSRLALAVLYARLSRGHLINAEAYFLPAALTAALTMSFVDGAAAVAFVTGFFGFLASRFPCFLPAAMIASVRSEAIISRLEKSSMARKWTLDHRKADRQPTEESGRRTFSGGSLPAVDMSPTACSALNRFRVRAFCPS